MTMTRSRRWLVGAGLVAAALVIATTVALVAYERYLSTPIDAGATRRLVVTIPQGSFGDVVEVLERQGLVTSPLLFGIHATLGGDRSRIRAGTFYLDPRWTPRELLDHLVEGAEEADFRELTVPEGLSVWLDRPQVFAFEGYLFPKTYRFPLDAKPATVIERLAKQWAMEWRAVVSAHRADYERVKKRYRLDDHALVTLASLVEEEAQVDAERAIIASVFYNRLAKGMKLQTDPTLVYHPDRYGKVPTVVDRKNAKNPYNTYAIEGLPPGPIASPGRRSLEAAVSPARTDFLFFVAKRDGTGAHHFSRTGEEHAAAVRRYLK
jgi:UPF0755 protein